MAPSLTPTVAMVVSGAEARGRLNGDYSEEEGEAGLGRLIKMVSGAAGPPSVGGPEPVQEPHWWLTRPVMPLLAGRRKFRLLIRASKDLELSLERRRWLGRHLPNQPPKSQVTRVSEACSAEGMGSGWF